MADQDKYGYEEEFQKLIVSAALKDPAFMKQNSDVLLPSYFDYEYLSSILRIARELTERLGSTPSKMTMVEEVKSYCAQFRVPDQDRDITLNKLEELYGLSVTDLEYIRERVVDFGKRQAIRSAVLQTVTLFNSSQKSSDIDDKVQMLFQSAFRVGMDSRDMGISLYTCLEDLPRMASKSTSGLSRKIPTLIPTFDKNTWGGYGRGEVWVVAGDPGRGKTAFLINIGAAALKSGCPVVHYTVGDLNEVDTGVRYAARLSMCTTYEVITGAESYIKKARRLSRYNPHLHIKYYPSGTATMGHIRAHLSKLITIEEFKPGLVIVDYPEELKRPRDDNLYLSGEENYAQANAIAAEFDVGVWLASQVKEWSPKHKGDVLTGQNMNESRRKHQKLDGLVTWNMTYEEQLQKRARLWVDKVRRTQSFYLIHMQTDLERMIIREGKPPENLDKD